MKWVSRILLIIMLLAIVAFLGTCAWQNCRNDTGPAPPPLEKAKYEVIIKATGVHYFTNEFFPIEGNNKAYGLNGYWEATKKKFIYHEQQLILDEKYFGEINIKVRVEK